MEDQGALRRAGESEVGCSDAERFQLELEFVQCLANPHYLNWLAQSRHFENVAFLKFLQYLRYWRQPAYARFIIYPHALYFLELLEAKEFRTAIANPMYKLLLKEGFLAKRLPQELVHSQQFAFWQHWLANRLKEGDAKPAGSG